MDKSTARHLSPATGNERRHPQPSNLEPKALYLDSWFRRYSMSLKPKLYSNPSAFSTADSAIIKLRNAGVFAWICGIVVDIAAPLCKELTNAIPSGFQLRIHNNRHTMEYSHQRLMPLA